MTCRQVLAGLSADLPYRGDGGSAESVPSSCKVTPACQEEMCAPQLVEVNRSRRTVTVLSRSTRRDRLTMRSETGSGCWAPPCAATMRTSLARFVVHVPRKQSWTVVPAGSAAYR